MLIVNDNYMEVTRKKSRCRSRRKLDDTYVKNILLQLLLADPTSFRFLLPSFSFGLLPWLSDYLGLLSFPIPQFFLCQHYPLSSSTQSLFWKYTYSSLLISNKENHFLCLWLISLQISQILSPPNLAQTSLLPRTTIFHFSLSFLCERTHLWNSTSPLKKKYVDFSHHILLPVVVKIILNLWLFFLLLFFLFTPLLATDWLPLSTHRARGTTYGKIPKPKD